MLKIDLGSPIPIYEQLVIEITKNVKSGMLQAGEALPSIRQLASQLDVAANTIARAYQELEQNGIVKKYGTKGTFVLDTNRKVSASYFKEMILKLLQEGKNKDQIKHLFVHEFNEIFN